MNAVFGPNVSVAQAMVSTNRVAPQLKPLGVILVNNWGMEVYSDQCIPLPQRPIRLHNVEFPSPEEKAEEFVALFAKNSRLEGLPSGEEKKTEFLNKMRNVQ